MFSLYCVVLIFFFKHETAYEIRISDLSSDVCSADLAGRQGIALALGWRQAIIGFEIDAEHGELGRRAAAIGIGHHEEIDDLLLVGAVHALEEGAEFLLAGFAAALVDRKSTRLNSSH